MHGRHADNRYGRVMTIRAHRTDDLFAGIADHCSMMRAASEGTVVVVHGSGEGDPVRRSARLRQAIEQRGMNAVLTTGPASRPLISDPGLVISSVIDLDTPGHDALLLAAERDVPLVSVRDPDRTADRTTCRWTQVVARYMTFATPEISGHALRESRVNGGGGPIAVATECQQVIGVIGHASIRVDGSLLAIDLTEPRHVPFHGRLVTITGDDSPVLVVDGRRVGAVDCPIAVDFRSAHVRTLTVTA